MPGLGKDEVDSSIKTLVDVCERWISYLRNRRGQELRSNATLIGLTVWAAVIAGIFVSNASLYPVTMYLVNHQELVAPFLAIVSLTSLLVGVSSYFVLRRDKRKGFSELSDVVARIKGDQNVSENALSLVDKLLAISPQVLGKRQEDALLYGLVAFVLAAFVAGVPISIFVGAGVWLYSKYEMNREHDQETSRLQEWKRKFEQQKNSFVQSL